MTFIVSILVLGFLIFIHELGHFLAAKSVGIKVEEFSVGFPPRVMKKTMGETAYSLGLIPLGGYVRMAGMGEEDEDPEDRRNYASKSPFQKLWVIAAGPLMNVILAFAVIPFVFFVGSEKPAYFYEEPEIYDVREGGLAELKGIKPGDKVLSLNGVDVGNWEEFNERIPQSFQSGLLKVGLSENGRVKNVFYTKEEMLESTGFGWIPRVEPRVGKVLPGSAAEEAELKKGDLIMSIDGTPIGDFSEISSAVQRIRNTAVELALIRENRRMTLEIQPKFSEGENRWLIGVNLPSKMVSNDFGESIKLGMEKMLLLSGQIVDFLRNLVAGDVHSDEVGGPITIFNVLGSASESGLSDFLFIMAFISFQLAILNLLPIPALDGGHILLILVELISGRTISPQFKKRYQQIGFLVLISLMVTVTFLDVTKFF